MVEDYTTNLKTTFAVDNELICESFLSHRNVIPLAAIP